MDGLTNIFEHVKTTHWAEVWACNPKTKGL